ncbi:MAG: hypothetical protein LQ346_003774 [Caloplaca aetnensis]|nr:MAG: hypothetical protein LQ346_003774 [Caloplaca aetnensis]
MASGVNQSFNQFLASVSPPSVPSMGFKPDRDCSHEMWNIDVSHPSSSSWPCAFVEPRNRKRRVAHSRPVKFPYALTHSATYNEDGKGYNITLPGELCADLVVGDFVAPGGRTFHNATLVTIHNALSHLSPIGLLAFTQRRARLAQYRLSEALQPYICDVPSSNSRSLLFRYAATDRSGDYCWALLNLLGTVSLFAGSMYVPLASPHFAVNWSGNERFAIATVGIALMTTWQIILDRLRRSELRFSRWEANVLNIFLAAGDLFIKALKASHHGVCILSTALWERLPAFCAQTQQPGLQAPSIGPGAQSADPNQLREIIVEGVCPASENT